MPGISRSDSEKLNFGHSVEPPMGQEAAVSVPKAGNERLKQPVPSMSYHVYFLKSCDLLNTIHQVC